jgi:hypothetical protein
MHKSDIEVGASSWNAYFYPSGIECGSALRNEGRLYLSIQTKEDANVENKKTDSNDDRNAQHEAVRIRASLSSDIG